MTDPYSPGKIGVTIKVPESARYAGDNPWFVFEGTSPEDIKAKIGATFGLDVEGLTMADAVINAQRHVTGLGNAAHGLGGTVLAKGAGATPAASGGDVWTKAAASKPAEKEAVDPILASIENAKTVDELKQIWAENQAAFADDKYMSPWKAKGKALMGN